MSTTVLDATSNSTVAKWEKKTWIEVYQQTAFGMIAASNGVYDASSYFRNDNGRGDNITFDYVAKLTDVPLGEGSTAFGNEEALDIGTHNMAINLTRIAVSNPNNGSIEQQRTNIQFDEVTAMHLAARAAELIDSSMFNQLAGVNQTSFTLNGTTYSGSDRLQVQGHNVPTAPTADRIIRAGAAATDEALTSGDTFGLDLIDFAIEEIMANDQPMKPCQDGYFKLFLHPFQVVDLKQDSTGRIQWYQNQLAAEAGGKESKLVLPYSDKPVELGVYNNVKIYQAPRVPQGQNSTTDAVITTAAIVTGKPLDATS